VVLAAFDALLDLLWPPRCRACDTVAYEVGREAPLCHACGARVDPPVPRCSRCGRGAGPIVLAGGCPRCVDEGWPLEGIVAGQPYRGVARDLVVALKFRARLDAAEPLARWLEDALRAARVPGDLVVPLPLAARRRASRGFNQAELLARPLARALDLALDPRALVRRRHDPAQSGQSPGRRRRGPRGAFVARRERVEGRCVLLVDDVLTSGATALAAARALYRAGAAAVVVCAACRSEGHPGCERLTGRDAAAGTRRVPRVGSDDPAHA
jgi:ComF family protein